MKRIFAFLIIVGGLAFLIVAIFSIVKLSKGMRKGISEYASERQHISNEYLSLFNENHRKSLQSIATRITAHGEISVVKYDSIAIGLIIRNEIEPSVVFDTLFSLSDIKSVNKTIGINYSVFDKGVFKFYYDQDPNRIAKKMIFEVEGHSKLVSLHKNRAIYQSKLKALSLKFEANEADEFFLATGDEEDSPTISLYTCLLKRGDIVYTIFISSLSENELDQHTVDGLFAEGND